jgi:hypothetical protein
MDIFEQPSNRHENIDIIRIDLEKRDYRLLVYLINRGGAESIKELITAQLIKDEKGYFIRAPYPDIKLILEKLRNLSKQMSDEINRLIPIAFTLSTPDAQVETIEEKEALLKFEALSKTNNNLQSLIESCFFQICPEEHHPFGPR